MALPSDPQQTHSLNIPNSLNIPKTDQVISVAGSADRYKVPREILFGVYGLETGWGSNVITNSKGYTGPFQFGVREAQKYGYPLVNNPDKKQFQKQSDAAAHYLSDLFKQYGSWDAALLHYSGNGYGQAQVLAEAKKAPKDYGIVGDIPGVKPLVDAANSVGNAAGDFFGLITSLEFWLRLGEGIAGLILIAMGLKTLTGISLPSAVPVPV